MRVIVLFNLRGDAEISSYEAWARENDIPGVRALASVRAFDVYRATGMLGSTATPPYQYIEIIDIVGIEQFGVEVGGDAVQQLAREFSAFAEDPQFILTERL